MNLFLLEALGVTAAILDLSMSLPQTWKIWRNKNTQGVSIFTWITLYITFAAWTIYTLQQQIVATIGFIIAALLIGVLLLPAIFKSRNINPAITWLTILGIPLLLSPFILYGPAILITIFLLSLTFNRIPQIFKSYRTYKHGSYSNVSLTTWSLGLAANLCWLAYGLIKPDINIILIPIMPIIYDSFILTFELLGNRKYAKTQKENPPK